MHTFFNMVIADSVGRRELLGVIKDCVRYIVHHITPSMTEADAGIGEIDPDRLELLKKHLRFVPDRAAADVKKLDRFLLVLDWSQSLLLKQETTGNVKNTPS